MKLLAEISGKLDYALRAAQRGPGGAAPAPPAPAPAEAPAPTGDLVRAMSRLAQATAAQDVVEAVLDAVVGATHADRAFVMLLEEGRKLRFKGGRSIDQDTAAAEGATLHSKTLIRKVISSCEPVLVPDTSTVASDVADMASVSIMGMNARSLLCVPFRMFGDGPDPKCGGVLYLDSRAQESPLTLPCQDAALAIADAASATLQRIERGNHPAPAAKPESGAQIQKLKENMHRLLDVGRAIGTTLVLDDLLAIALEKVLEVTRADRGFIMLLEGGKPVFKIGRTWNKKDGAARRSTKLDETQFFFSKTIVNRALNEGRSICIKDTVGGGEDASVSIVQMELQSVMATPLREKNQTLGMIYVDSKAASREFDQSDLELFEALAGQAAIALQNAILYASAKDKSRLESEINIAAQMQADMCPKVVPVLPGVEVAGTMFAAKEVGGDYYDLVEDPHTAGASLSLIVGDVSGKGLGAGIVAVMARCFLRSMITAYGVESPQNLLSYLNTILSADLKPGVFMTMLMCVWDAQKKVIRYSAAGHEHIIVYRARTKKAEAIRSGGTALGLSASTGPIADAELRLDKGDVLVLYSDGVTEAMNVSNEEFELERLLESVKKHGSRSALEIVEGIGRDVKDFVGKADQSDDITLVVLRKT
jgi:sigma-B regulation protein RsbU (phosphoserine phosphatase)